VSRYSTRDLARAVIGQGIAATISGATVWRWLSQDAIRPWYHRSWIFPRDPQFEAKGARVLDLYHRVWNGEPLGSHDFVTSADEKTSIQARSRRHPVVPPRACEPMRVEHEYKRAGALAYLAAWDVHRAKLFGRCEPTTGIVPFDGLVGDVMSREPYASAERVFWIVDNGSSHRGKKSVERLQRRWPNLILVHLPIHASWAQSDRDILLDTRAESATTKQRRFAIRPRRCHSGLSGALPTKRAPLRLEVLAR